MIISGLKCSLRKWNKKDSENLVKLANDPEIAKNLRNLFPYPYTLADAEEYIRFAVKQKNPQRIFAIEYAGELAGSAGFKLFDDVYAQNAEIGYWVGRKFWNNGIATETAALLTEYIFRTTPVNRVYAECFALNEASLKVLEKNHFIREGCLRKHVFKNNRYQDCFILGILRSEWEKIQSGK